MTTEDYSLGLRLTGGASSPNSGRRMFALALNVHLGTYTSAVHPALPHLGLE